MESKNSQRSVTGARSANVFSIPAGSRFLDVLVQALLEGKIIPGFVPRENSLLLPTATIYVPNRRTARALALAFLDAGGPKARLLPSIKTLGDADDDVFGPVEGLEDIEGDQKVVGALERQLELAKLIHTWVDALSAQTRRLYGDEEIFIPSSQADAVRLAGDLCNLLDQIIQEETKWNAIGEIVPDEHAQWWSITSSFLKIIMENWPAILAEQNLIDPAMRARLMINTRIDRYRKSGSPGPVIIAGSTGSVPSTRRLLHTVSELANGAVILPGLDKSISAPEWAELQSETASADETMESHPQFGLANLLASIQVTRDNVIDLGVPDEPVRVRNWAVSNALSLPRFSGEWQKTMREVDNSLLDASFENVSLIEAVNERQEAVAIAVALRETLEVPDRTAALVTPDRNLARRVAVELKRFSINVDDTAGKPLGNTPAGLFTRQLVRFCFGTGSKAELAELLKSPFLRLGLSQPQARRNGEAAELLALRGVIGTPVCGKLSDFFHAQKDRLSQKHSKPVEAEENPRWADILSHMHSMDQVMKPLMALVEHSQPVRLGDYGTHLADALASLSANEEGTSALESVSGAAEISGLFEDILGGGAADFEIYPSDFPSVFEALFEAQTVRQGEITHPRLHIYGPLEIRLLDYDRIVMAGLNEGTWPQVTRNDAFLNRTMRQQLGMASPERRTGLSAHDFQQIMGKREVVLSRSLRVDKAPTIASRWVQRLGAFLGEALMGSIRKRGRRYINYAMLLDNATGSAKRRPRPEPKPPLDSRPTRLPVTDIETWIRDPYALYAKRILKLRALDPLERTPDHLLRGTLYHSILEEYVSVDCMRMSADKRLEKLLEIAQGRHADEALDRDVELVWQYRFEEIARRFVLWEQDYCHAENPCRVHKEINGEIVLSNRNFRLFARADRIDVLQDGRLMVLDYKTGSSPSPKQARTLSPQLVLEGFIAREGGFENIGRQASVDLAFIRLLQGKGFGMQRIVDKKTGVDATIEMGKASLEELVDRFQDETVGYVSRRAPFRDGDISGDYDHLARTREWSFGEEEGEA